MFGKISRAGRVAQVAERLPSKFKALSSNPRTKILKTPVQIFN
jgi:hypothetical protein